MNKAIERLNKFDDFVKNIDLDGYRKKYSSIKIVEMDLPKEIQALDTMYKYYWDEINFNAIMDFENYYKQYYSSNKDKIENFRIKVGMCSDCFNRGLKARIYRTWASLITQIHAGYVAESVFGLDTVDMSTELDHKGKDMVIHHNDVTVPIQIKKVSKRPEARIERTGDDSILVIRYCVPSRKDFANPRYVMGEHKGEIKPQMLDFIEYNPKSGILNRHKNGFVVFGKEAFMNLH